MSPSNPDDALRAIAEALEKKYASDLTPPKHHPSDVRFYLARGIFWFVGVLILAEIAYTSAYTWFHASTTLQATLDAFGLFDAAIFALLGTVLGFYFASKANE